MLFYGHTQLDGDCVFMKQGEHMTDDVVVYAFSEGCNFALRVLNLKNVDDVMVCVRSARIELCC